MPQRVSLFWKELSDNTKWLMDACQLAKRGLGTQSPRKIVCLCGCCGKAATTAETNTGVGRSPIGANLRKNRFAKRGFGGLRPPKDLLLLVFGGKAAKNQQQKRVRGVAP